MPRALEMFEKSAKLGLEMAQLELGIMLEKGKGITPDLEGAFYWFSKSAETPKPIPKALYKLGSLFLFKIVVLFFFFNSL